MGRRRPKPPTLTVVFKNHPSPGKGGKFRLIYDSERHCESQIRSLERHKGVKTVAQERKLNGRKFWQITINGFNVQGIKSARSNKGEREYHLAVLNLRAALRLDRCLGLPDTRTEFNKDSGRWVVIVRSTFTEDEMDWRAHSDVQRAQVSRNYSELGRSRSLMQCLCS